MNKEIAKKWCAALRSGEYRQGKHCLHNVVENSYCCLGVLCDLFIKNGGQLRLGRTAEGSIQSYNGNPGLPPSSVVEWAGMTCSNGMYNSPNDNLVSHNDDGMSFAEIANIIEAQVDNL